MVLRSTVKEDICLSFEWCARELVCACACEYLCKRIAITMAVILCKKYSTFHARLFMCAHTYLCPRAHESWRTSCAHAENKSYTRPLKFHVHFSAYMRTPVLVFSQQYGLAKKKIDVLVLFVTPI